MDNFKEYNFKFNKSFGQNFIFDKNLLSAIVSDACVENKNVLEIGPGAGTLTKEMCKKAKRVIAYEIDKNLEEILNDNLNGCDNVKVVFADFMKVNMKDVEKDFCNEEYVVVANLPYYITTPIIFKLIEESNNLQSINIMVQKEVGDRLIARPNTKDYGAITASLNYRSDIKIMRVVKRNMFVPAPNVDSCIIKIDFNKNKFQIHDENVLNRLIKSAFAMRRKTLANNLKSTFNLSNEKIHEMLEKSDLSINVRGEVLGAAEFVVLSNNIAKLL